MAKKIRVYCSGGCGVNIGQQLIKAFETSSGEAYPDVDVAMIDTSLANLERSRTCNDRFYHVQGDAENPTDGSGMVRKTNYPAIVKSAQHILVKFPPGDFNIFVQSASGGSGSVAGLILLSKVLESKKPAVVILVGSRGCEREISNTIDTIESLQGISQKFGMPVCCHYYENNSVISDKLLSSKGVDNMIFRDIYHWCLLHSDKVMSLDSKDISNFLNYPIVTSHQPSLTSLELTAMIPHHSKQGTFTLAALTLHAGDESEHVAQDETIYPYHVFGVMDAALLERMNVPKVTRLLNNQGLFQLVLRSLKQDLDKVNAAQSAAMVSEFKIDYSNIDNNGMKM